MPLNNTTNYTTFHGVFQGGGVKGIALAGAYEAAYTSGIRFSEVAGTSAGSIIAALIGAGAKPKELYEAIERLDFLRFLVCPSQSIFKSKFPLKLAPNTIWGAPHPMKKKYSMIMKFMKSGGLYSSEEIEKWIEIELKKLLPEVKGTVKFEDLPTPTHIIASNLGDRKAKVWSKYDTPTSSVAFAVRASCSIPIFFQPVMEGLTAYVDGGIISNLPSFVFSNRGKIHRKSSEKIIAFSLESSETEPDEPQAIDYLMSLANLTVEGATNLQLSLQPEVTSISINTGAIQATDFGEMNGTVIQDLISREKKAMGNYINDEYSNISKSLNISGEVWDIQKCYLSLVERSSSVKDEVIIAERDTNWFWELFPTILGWRQRGISITCLTVPCHGTGTEQKKESQRRDTLKGMGVHVEVIQDMPIQGILTDGTSETDAFAIIFTADMSGFSPLAKIYKDRVDAPALQALHAILKQKNSTQPQGLHRPSVVSHPVKDIIKRLKNHVSQYKPEKVELTFEKVKISQVCLISKYVRAYRLRQLPDLKNSYKESQLEEYEGAKVILDNDKESIITPPVFEAIGDKFVALEGNTRCYLAYNDGETSINAIVARNVETPYPGTPIKLEHIHITENKLEPEQRTPNFDYSLFRHIERAVRPI